MSLVLRNHSSSTLNTSCSSLNKRAYHHTYSTQVLYGYVGRRVTLALEFFVFSCAWGTVWGKAICNSLVPLCKLEKCMHIFVYLYNMLCSRQTTSSVQDFFGHQLILISSVIFFRLYISLIIKNNVYFLWFAGKRKTRLDHSSNIIVLGRSNIIFQVEDVTNKNEGNGIKSYLFWKIWHRLQPSMFWETRRKQGFCLYLKKNVFF